MKSRKNLAFVFLAGLVLILAGCGSDDGAQKCKATSDCESKSCQTAQCLDKKCVYNPIPDCCGNLQCEDGERCTCEQDCLQNKCEGKVAIGKDRRGNDIVAQYLGEYCNENDECVKGADPEDVTQVNLVNEFKVSRDATISLTSTFNKPSVVAEDRVLLSFKLKDLQQSVQGAVTITEVRVTSGSTLFGKAVTNLKFNTIGDIREVSIPIDLYYPTTGEEKHKLSIQFDVKYDLLIRDEIDTTVLSLNQILAEEMILIDPSFEPEK